MRESDAREAEREAIERERGGERGDSEMRERGDREMRGRGGLRDG